MRLIGYAFAGFLILAGALALGRPFHVREPERSEWISTLGSRQATDPVLREQLENYVFWFRDAVSQEIAYNAVAAARSEANLVTSARQIAASIRPFYGNEVSSDFLALLARQYGIVRLYLDASRTGSVARQGRARIALANNARQLAVFLSDVNRHLPRESLVNLLVALEQHQILDIRQLLEGKRDEEAQTWEEIQSDAAAIADALSRALAEQFLTRIG